MVKKPQIVPSQARAARAWLQWTRAELSAASGVSETQIAKFEKGLSVPYSETLVHLQEAFERAGICFQFDELVGTGISYPRRSWSTSGPRF